MNSAAFSPTGTGPSPDALRNYLSERSRHELDALRSDLDTRLTALENALTSPDECESRESLVIDLAHVAMDEAEASTRRAIFEAQADAQAQVDAARADARSSIDAARTTAAALHRDLDTARAANVSLQKELEEARSALKAERETSGGLQKDLQKARTSLEAERSALKALRREVEEAQAALANAEDSTSTALARAEESSAAALRRATEEADRRVADAEEAGERELRRVRDEFTDQLARERATIAELTDAQAKLEPLLAAALNDADARSAEIDAAVARADALEQRWKEAEQARDRAVAQVEGMVRERDTLALELETARKANQTDAEALASAKQARQEAEAKVERLARERDALAKDLDATARDLKDVRGRYEEASRDLKSIKKASQSESGALAAAERARAEAETACEEAEARAEAALRERDEMAKELEAAGESTRGANAAVDARVEELDAERARLMREWQEDVVRLEVALRERDALAADLEAIRQATATAQAEERARQQEFYDAAEQRIRELERQLLQPQFESGAEEEEPGPAAPDRSQPAAAAAPVHDPPRRASRHAFSRDVQIQIDGSATQLVDLSTTGAQVISPTALKPNRMVKVSLPMDDNPISCRGKIVWARLEPPTAGRPLCYRAGVLFTSVDEVSIQAFITHHVAVAR